MIPNNLKVGDKFTEEHRTFEVLALDPLGYVSRLVSSNPAPEYVQEAPSEATEAPIEEAKEDSYTKTEINRLSTKELEALCDKLGLEKGTGVLMKKTIIDHLGL